MDFLYDSQMDLIRIIQHWRTPVLDSLFKFFDHFDRPEFYLFLFSFVWVGYFWKPGLRLLFILSLSSALNHMFKELFEQPRPFHLDPAMALITVKGYGLPSGAAQTAMLLASILVYSFRTYWAWMVALMYLGLVSFSRLYLGVHFFTDLVGGWSIGLGLFLLYRYVMLPAEPWIARQSSVVLAMFSLVISLLILATDPTYPTVIMFVTGCIAGSLGTLALVRYSTPLPYPRSYGEFFVRGLIALLGIYAINSLLSELPKDSRLLVAAIKGVVTVLWYALLAQLICRPFIRPTRDSEVAKTARSR